VKTVLAHGPEGLAEEGRTKFSVQNAKCNAIMQSYVVQSSTITLAPFPIVPEWYASSPENS
jgi:hypothetical protein